MRDCFVLGERSIAVLIKWNEIIQKKEKTLETELQRLHPDPLYPAVAVLTATGYSGSGHPTNQTFPVSGSEFNKRIKTVAGADQDFSSPSFRRSGATHALCCDVTAAVIRTMGDRKSNVDLHSLDQRHQSLHTGLCCQPSFSSL